MALSVRLLLSLEEPDVDFDGGAGRPRHLQSGTGTALRRGRFECTERSLTWLSFTAALVTPTAPRRTRPRRRVKVRPQLSAMSATVRIGGRGGRAAERRQ